MGAWQAVPRLHFASGLFGASWLAEAAHALPPNWVCSESTTAEVDAEVVVFHLPELPALPTATRPASQLWVGVTAECDAYYPHQADPTLLDQFDLLASYHQDSELPLDYTVPARLDAMLAPTPEKDRGADICALVSNGHSRSGREALLLALDDLLPVHHYGRWHTTHRFDDTGRASKLALLSRYRFCLAFENSVDRDYVTEKWFDCLVAGCVPVYYGAPNIADFAPADDCFVDVRAFANVHTLAAHLRTVAADPQRYARYFDWKTRPLPAAFRRRFDPPTPLLLHRLCALLDRERATAG